MSKGYLERALYNYIKEYDECSVANILQFVKSKFPDVYDSSIYRSLTNLLKKGPLAKYYKNGSSYYSARGIKL